MTIRSYGVYELGLGLSFRTRDTGDCSYIYLYVPKYFDYLWNVDKFQVLAGFLVRLCGGLHRSRL